MTLKGISAGETIQTAEFSAPDGIALAGDGVLDFSSATADWSAAEENTVSLDMKNYPAASGDVVVWFSAVPATLTGFTVKVTTTNASSTIYNYEKSVSSSNALPLTASCVSSFSIDLSGYKTEYAAPVKQEKDFTPLTDNSQIEVCCEIIVCADTYLYVSATVFSNSGYKLMTNEAAETTTTKYFAASEDSIADGGVNSTPPVTIPEATAADNNAAVFTLIDNGDGTFSLRSEAGKWLNALAKDYNLTLDDTRVTGWSFNPSAKPSSETQLLFQSKYESVPGYLISRYGFAGNFEVYFDSGSGAVNTGVEVYWRGTAE